MKTWRSWHGFLGKRKKRKKRMLTSHDRLARIHSSYRKEEEVKTNWMTRQNNIFNHQSQPYSSLEDSGVADKCNAYVSSFLYFCIFFFLRKYYSTLRTQTLLKKIIVKLQISPSSKAFENLNPRIID
jgi:hypothetical protein